MGAYALPSAAPNHALRIWVDGPAPGYYYVEYPAKGQAPFIVSYPLTPQGLATATAAMIDAWQKANPTPRRTASDPRIKRTANPVGSAEQRAMAHGILKKMGIL
ncbi:MAG: hypothetical protein E6Q97_34815 [Desulfurellales bacterium]|nr:MAG: hypothetical protein E6Q97_34815 [Desulfurellales bacterium]